MNLSFRLPVQFFWEQIRHILGKEQVPEQSPYSREVLSWRLDALLDSDDIKNSSLCQEATRYWLDPQTQFSDRDKRFQLAEQLADLFEQYQIYRPDWIENWTRQSAEAFPGQEWQALLWQKLVAEIPEHPVSLLRKAINQVDKATHLPERISLFGINALPPLWLDFLSVLGDYCQVHLYHLNPCVEYWGEIKTDKALAREQFYRWLKKPSADVEDLSDLVGNPTLSNLGGQGREFLTLLQEYSSIEIPLFEDPQLESPQDYQKNNNCDTDRGPGISTLNQLQQDILNLHDARNDPQIVKDNSISFTSAHSALREIQALHDWLLHQFNNDRELTPKDVLVMCPNIENYAPYVEAVFAHGLGSGVISEQLPPLPCSIADRTLKDSEPLVQAFMQCLELPDSRFQVNQILAFLRLPAVQQKFCLMEVDIQVLERWLKHAAIHWGLDSQHKQQILGVAQSNNKFSWAQGLKRLLLGFAHSDHESLYHQQLLLGDVEGDEALLLGRFFKLLEQLQLYASNLQQARTAAQWQVVLQQLKNELFAELTNDAMASDIIQQAINDLGEYTDGAGYKKAIPLVVMRDFLQNHFNQPEPGRQFLSGQVTFCSMVPMRSLPFKIIAVLGLNDSEFPRHRQAMGFDLMAREAPRKGDRSRRGDDRYLFLEAIISCREKLYLSYQGHDIKTNSVREPSLVLSELMGYLEKAYGWKLGINKSSEDIFQVPLQAFNKANYLTERKSFSEPWLKLSEPGTEADNLKTLPPLADDEQIKLLVVDDLVNFFDHPAKYFAQHRLKLFAEDYAQSLPEDNEPFVVSHLDRYSIQQEIIALQITGRESQVNDYIQSSLAGGHLPDVPDIEQTVLQWQQQAMQFSELLQQYGADQISLQSAIVDLGNVNVELKLEAQLPVVDGKLLLWRLASPKGKDDIRLWLYHLIAQIDCQAKGIDYAGAEGLYRGKEDNFLSVKLLPVESPQSLLQELIACWQTGLQKPLLLNAALGREHCYAKIKKKPKPMTNTGFYSLWKGGFNTLGLADDPYIKWFWQGRDIPQWENQLQLEIEKLYDPLYQCRQEQQIEVSDD